jgi:hypothetical protein
LRRFPARTIKIAFLAARAPGLLAGIIVDAGNMNRASIGIDGDGAAAILESVLGLRGGEAARQQEHGDSETLLHYCDLLSREPQSPKLLRAGSFPQSDPNHFQTMSRVLAALVQIQPRSLICLQWTVNFLRKSTCPTGNQSNQAA